MGYTVHGIIHARIQEWVPVLFTGDLSNPGIKLRFPTLQIDSLPAEPPGKFSSVQSLSHVWLFETPWTAACQASWSITNCRSLPKPMSIESVMPSNSLTPLSSLSPPALNLSQHQGLFKWVSSLHQVAKVLEFQLQHQSFQWTSRTDLL